LTVFQHPFGFSALLQLPKVQLSRDSIVLMDTEEGRRRKKAWLHITQGKIPLVMLSDVFLHAQLVVTLSMYAWIVQRIWQPWEEC
jgi:hypothetical protein